MYEFSYVFIGIFFSFSFNKLESLFSNVTSTYYMEMKIIYYYIYIPYMGCLA